MNEMASLLRSAAASALRGVHTALPGRILSYDAGAQRASVQPALGRKQPGGEEEKLPVLNDVPVLWPRSGGASMTFPVRSGDGCLLVFCERSLDEWKGQGGEVTPSDPRQMDLSDAVALMGFVHFGGGGGPSDKVQIKMGSTTLQISGSKVEIEGNLTLNGNLEVDGTIRASGDIDGNVTL